MTEQKTAKEQAREKVNPIPNGPEGIKTLRGLRGCPIPEESKNFNQLLDKILRSPGISFEDIASTLGNGLTSVILADFHCRLHKTQRQAVRFEDDPELQGIHTKIKEQGTRFNELQQELMALSQELQANLKQRWFTAVKKFGLAPEKYSYEFDEDAGVIYLVDLDCASCTGKNQVHEARQQLAEKLLNFERKAADDRTGKDGSDSQGTGDGRESSPAE